MELTKKQILENINWDSNISIKEIIEIIENKKDNIKGLTKEKIFVRTLERLKWRNLLIVWDNINNCNNLYTEKVSKALRNKYIRYKYDYVFGLLRGKPIQNAGWGSEYSRKCKDTFLSDRWNRNK